MVSVTPARRLIAIVLVLLLILWLLMVMGAYLGKNWEEESFRPSPERLAAIVEAVELARPEQRATLLSALNAPVLSLSVVSPTDQPQAGEALRAVDEQLIDRYRDALGGGRSLVAAIYKVPASSGDMPRIAWRDKTMLEFRIGMRTGETLVVRNTSPVLVTAFGLPIGLTAGLTGTLAALMALLALYREIKPLGELARAVDRIDLNGGTIALPDTRRQSAEIKALVVAFDQLQQRLSQLLRSRMTMIAGISHDVRTFATRLRLRVDAIADEAKRERAVSDISDMIRMLDDALLAAQVGAGDLPQELVDLSVLAREESNDRRLIGLSVSFTDQTGARQPLVLADPLSMRRVIGNLIDNAVKYGHRARVSVAIDQTYAVLCVEDDGPGISPEQATLFTEPFVRGEGSRSRDTGGAGLGLAIAKSLIQAHGGTLQFGMAPQGGARITVQIPIYEI